MDYDTYGSIFGNDPLPAVNALVKGVTKANKGQLPATGSFVLGADLVDAVVAAINKTHSTKGSTLALDRLPLGVQEKEVRA